MIEILLDPDSPGMKIPVRRTWIGRLFKPRDFATTGEVLKYHRACELVFANKDNVVAGGRIPPDDLNRRVAVEQRLLDAYEGKQPLPDREECKALAYKLGVPEEFRD